MNHDRVVCFKEKNDLDFNSNDNYNSVDIAILDLESRLQESSFELYAEFEGAFFGLESAILA